MDHTDTNLGLDIALGIWPGRVPVVDVSQVGPVPEGAGPVRGGWNPVKHQAFLPVRLNAYERTVRLHESLHALYSHDVLIHRAMKFRTHALLEQGLEDMRIHRYYARTKGQARRDELTMALKDLRIVARSMYRPDDPNFPLLYVVTGRCIAILASGGGGSVNRWQRLALTKALARIASQGGWDDYGHACDLACKALAEDDVDTAREYLRPFYPVVDSEGPLPEPKAEPTKAPGSKAEPGEDDGDGEPQDDNTEGSKDGPSEPQDGQGDEDDTGDDSKGQESEDGDSEAPGGPGKDGGTGSGRGDREPKFREPEPKDLEAKVGTPFDAAPGVREVTAAEIEAARMKAKLATEAPKTVTAPMGMAKPSSPAPAPRASIVIPASDRVTAAPTIIAGKTALPFGHVVSGPLAKMAIWHLPGMYASRRTFEGPEHRTVDEGAYIQARKLASLVGPVPTGRVFSRKLQGNYGGTILLDASGSMGINSQRLAALAESLPMGTVAYYSAPHDSDVATDYETGKRGLVTGNLCIYSHNMRAYVYPGSGPLPYHESGNLVDLHALDWLLKQPGPRFIMTDGGFTGNGSGAARALLQQALDRRLVTQFAKVADLVEFMQSRARARVW